MNTGIHNNTLKEWQKRPLYTNEIFVSNGPIDWDCWDKFHCRVLDLAKEVNAGNGSDKNWSLPETIRCEWEGPKYKIWWTAGY